MLIKSKLSVSINEAQFSKDFMYKITIDFEKQQKETDISAIVRNPIFVNNTHYFDIPSNHTLQGSLLFVAHMIVQETQSKSNRSNEKQLTRILGQCSLDLSPFALQPSETFHLPIRQQLKFTRYKDNKDVTVGRFIASIKIVNQQNLPKYIQDLQQKRIQKNQYYANLPDYDQSMSFDWRIKMQIRQALNIPLTDGLKPQVLIQVGWTQYKDSLPQQKRIVSTATLNTSHPQWNQTILITNPHHVKQPKGYIMLILRDKNNLQDLFKTFIPVQSMGSFIPYNIKLFKQTQNSIGFLQLYISMILQTSNRQKLYDIIINDITFDPMVIPFKQINLALTIQSENQPKIKFYNFNPIQDNIQRILQFDDAEEFNYILSQSMRIPTMKTGTYRAATVFTLSQSMLKKKISFYLVGRIDKTNYKIGGIAQSVQKDLVNLLIENIKKKLFIPVRNHPSIKFGNCQIQISHKADNNSVSSSQVSLRMNKGEQTASQKLMKQLNFSSNQSMLRHVAQNNEIISRILKELDDKNQSLRQAAAEISDLRGRVKLLQNENGILRQQSLKQEDQLVTLVQRQVQNMGTRELKQKIIKISQLYKAQKIKCRQLDKTIKLMEPQISNTMQLNSIIASQKNAIQTLTQKTERMVKQHQRINVYKQTIKKQEKVIVKLEKVMRDGMQEVRNARKMRVQLQELRKGKQSQQGRSIASRGGRQQIERLQNIIAQLQSTNKFNSSKNGQQEDNNNFQLQFKLHQAQTRIASLQEQLSQKSKSYARQLAMLRMKIVQKSALMDGYMH